MADEKKSVEKAEKQVEKAVATETDQGFRGNEIDSTPNENYTVKGVLAGKPVPETAADPVAARREAASQ